MKGIILAGGHGTRLFPLTRVTSKQLLPVYDKPMVYYPLSVLMLAGIREILVISTPSSTPQIRHLLHDGSALGLEIDYAVQDQPRGIAEALLIGSRHIGSDDVALILGDNIFHGAGLSDLLTESRRDLPGCAIFSYQVSDPQRYGIVTVDRDGVPVDLEEKPTHPTSNHAVTGLYLYESDAVEIARELRPSERGELEISDVNLAYIKAGRARLRSLARGLMWLDAGTPDALMEAGHYVQVIERRQGIKVACLEEIALRMGFISAAECERLAASIANAEYRRYLSSVVLSADPVRPLVGPTT